MHQGDEHRESTSTNPEDETEPTPIPVGKADELIGRSRAPASIQRPVDPDVAADIDPGEWHEDDEWRPSDQAEDA